MEKEIKNSSIPKLNTIFLCRFGSHLYGTNTPDSDVDWKGVYVESIENILLKKDSKSYRSSTGDSGSRNTSADVDVEIKELRTFLNDAMSGQTYAIDMLFCNEQNTISSNWVWNLVIENRKKLLSKNIMPFIGYCRKQAAKYGLKGTRLAALENTISTLSAFNSSIKLGKVLPLVALEGEFVKIVKSDNETFFEVLGKKFQVTKSVGDVLGPLKNMWEKYGDRARKAMENDGVDWKAVSHAYRAMYEVNELLLTGKIIFPLSQSGYLIDIKTGKIPWSQINEELPELMKQVEIASSQSKLQEKPDRQFWDEFVLDVYNVK